MLTTALVMLFLLFFSNQGLTYEQASQKASKEGKPLLVILGASWCVPCKALKQDVIEPMRAAGDLDAVVLCYVDAELQPKVAEALMKGPTVPQLVVLHRGSRYRLEGYQSRRRVLELIRVATE